MGVERQIDITISQSIIDETLRVLRDKFKTTEAELDVAEKVHVVVRQAGGTRPPTPRGAG